MRSIKMVKIREIFRLQSLGIGIRATAKSCKCSRNTVREVLRTAELQNLSWPLPERDLLEVIEDRTQVNSTVILSQLSTQDWHGLFSDPIAGDAVLDRLIHGSYQIKLESKESMRGFNFQRT